MPILGIVLAAGYGIARVAGLRIAHKILLGRVGMLSLGSLAGAIGESTRDSWMPMTDSDYDSIVNDVKDNLMASFDTTEGNAEALARDSVAAWTDPDILWPTHKRGDRAGQKIIPNYQVVQLTGEGRTWYSEYWLSKKFMRTVSERAYKRGIAAGKRQVAQTQDLMEGVRS